MNEHPKVAVLMTLFNGQEWVLQQVKTIINQSNINLTLFISDDGSNDLSVTVLKDLLTSNHNVIMLDKEISTGSAAQNFFHLIKTVYFDDYDYVALSDQDDIWNQGKLENAITALVKFKVDGYSSNVTAFWPNGEQILINKAQMQQEFDYMFESAGPGCTFVITKKLAKDIQEFLIRHQEVIKEVALHDWFIYAYARFNHYSWFIDPQSNMLYRQHDKNVIGANSGINAKLIRVKMLREGWLVKQALIISKLIGYNHSWPMSRIQQLTLFNRIYIAINSFRFRRRLLDQFAFAISILLVRGK